MPVLILSVSVFDDSIGWLEDIASSGVVSFCSKFWMPCLFPVSRVWVVGSSGMEGNDQIWTNGF